MKAKYLSALVVLLIFFGCDDNTGNVGLDMLPGSDKLSVQTETFDVITKSIEVDSVFAKTSIGYVGKFTDPDFGYYEASFLAQLNCTENLTFPKMYSEDNLLGEMAGDTLAYVHLNLYYTYFGDSLNASRMSIYEMNKEPLLEKNYYTTINPEKYYSPDNLLARKAYTAVDMSISDSIRNIVGNRLIFSLDKKIGQRIVKANWDNPDFFKNAENFIKNVFPGLYVKNDYGEGTILYIDQIYMDIAFPVYRKDTLDNTAIMKNSEDKDSIYLDGRTFAATKEVIQANKFINSEKIKEKVEQETEWTYLKSPAGIFTQATLPIQEIYEKLGNDTINSVKLTFTGYQNEKHEGIDDIYQMSPPSQILLVREKDMEAFFEENKLYDGVTSYMTSNSNNTYTFGNISLLINACINEKKEVMNNEGKNWTKEEWDKWEEKTKWNSIVLVPVTTKMQSTTLIGIEHDLKPGYVKLKGGAKGAEENGEEYRLKLEVHYTVFE